MVAIDADGRPLFERRASSEALTDVPFDLRPCPYFGTRHNHKKPMNWSAFQQIQRNWGAVRAIVSDVHHAHCRAYPRQEQTAEHLFWMATTIQQIPICLARRTTHLPSDLALSSAFSSVFKVAVGLVTVTARLCTLIWISDKRDAGRLSPQAILNFAERGGHLIGRYGVCPAPSPMIREILTCLIDGEREERAEGSELRRHLKIEILLRYSTVAVKSAVVADVVAVRDHFTVGLVRAHLAGVEPIASRLAQWEEQQKGQGHTVNPMLPVASADASRRVAFLGRSKTFMERLEAVSLRSPIPQQLFSSDRLQPPREFSQRVCFVFNQLADRTFVGLDRVWLSEVVAEQLYLRELAASANSIFRQEQETILETTWPTVTGPSMHTLLDFFVADGLSRS
jgi:hypothetical protein